MRLKPLTDWQIRKEKVKIWFRWAYYYFRHIRTDARFLATQWRENMLSTLVKEPDVYLVDREELVSKFREIIALFEEANELKDSIERMARKEEED